MAKKHVLLVDDDDDEFLIMSDAIEAAGLPMVVTHIKDPLEVVEAYKRYTPDFIFVDINMPVMDGLQCIGHMRENGITEPPFVVVYSTSITSATRQTAGALGVTLFLKKNTSVDGLIEDLSDLLSNNN